jgi:ribosomal protein S18 acetylase RimI-like enzyme
MPHTLNIVPFCRDDIALFLKLAAAENWLAETWEFEFLHSVFSQGCFAARSDDGDATGFVTSLKHERSGWIGNLIVAEKFRGRGIGEKLFISALKALRSAGVETFWLTASKSGQRLYEKYGFKNIDTITRWSGKGRQRHAGHDRQESSDSPTDLMSDIDFMAWGDQRGLLLATTSKRGRVVPGASGFSVIQTCRDAVQFGPFSALDSSAADHIFNAAVASVPLETRVYIDAPASNRSAVRLFRRRGMQIYGNTELMYAGKKPDYQPELIYGLATMGSCG